MNSPAGHIGSIQRTASATGQRARSVVNAHVAAVLPGAALSVQALLSHLEAEPGGFLVDRWATTSLLAEAARWLRLAGSSTLIAYLSEESPDSERRFYERNGFEVLSRVRRDWVRG